MAHTVCHIEIAVTDLQRAQAFYSKIFDWSFRQFGPEMIVFGSGDQHIGGFMKADRVVAGESPSVWFEVESIEAMLDKARAAGGSVVAEKSEVPSVGWSAAISDLDGNRIGMVQFAK